MSGLGKHVELHAGTGPVTELAYWVAHRLSPWLVGLIMRYRGEDVKEMLGEGGLLSGGRTLLASRNHPLPRNYRVWLSANHPFAGGYSANWWGNNPWGGGCT